MIGNYRRFSIGLVIVGTAFVAVAQGSPQSVTYQAMQYAGWRSCVHDGAALEATFGSLARFDADAQGNVVIADTSARRIRYLSVSGQVTTLAGTGSIGAVDGPVAAASFDSPSDVAFGSNGEVFVVDLNNTIRRVAGGVVTTVAGLAGASGSADGPGTAARFSRPRALDG